MESKTGEKCSKFCWSRSTLKEVRRLALSSRKTIEKAET